jgi:hypothetical protein
MPRPKAASLPSQPTPPLAPRLALLLGAIVLAAVTIASSLAPSARSWGFHAAAFLDSAHRWVIGGTMIAALGLIVYGLFSPRALLDRSPRPSKRAGWRSLLPWLLPIAWLAFGQSHLVREPLLGDSAFWIQDVQAETVKLGAEPLSGRLLDEVADFLRSRGAPVDQRSLGIVSRVAGVAATAVAAAIAVEVGGAVGWAAALALLVTLGTSQLYFGYVESYPIALPLVLVYLWLGLRALRGATPVWAAGVALGIACAAHVTVLLLLPSYLYLAWRGSAAGGARWPRRAAEGIIPVVVLALALPLLSYDLENLAHPFRMTTHAARSDSPELFLRPYRFFSGGHAADVANAAGLAAPVAFLLLVAGALALPRRVSEWPAGVSFLVAASLGGVGAVAALMTPVAPAQDWDLFAFLLAPAAVCGVALAAATLPRAFFGPTAVGLVTLSVSLLLPFVLVNADSKASIARFERVVNDPARVSPFGRAYGNEILWILHRDRPDLERSLRYARAAYEAEPTNPRYSVNLGHSLLSLRRVEEAIPHFQRAAAASSRWDAPFNLGLSYTSLRRYPEALAALTESTRRDPNRPEVWSAIVRALVLSGREDSAVVVWNHVKEKWPEYVEAERRKRGQP